MADGMPLVQLIAGGGTRETNDVSDADFATERVAMEHSSARQDRTVEQQAAVTRITRSTLAVTNDLAADLPSLHSTALTASANATSGAAQAAMVGGAGSGTTATASSAGFVCYAGEMCELSFLDTTGDSNTSLRIVQVANPPRLCCAHLPTAFAPHRCVPRLPHRAPLAMHPWLPCTDAQQRASLQAPPTLLASPSPAESPPAEKPPAWQTSPFPSATWTRASSPPASSRVQRRRARAHGVRSAC
jgi:hypothetical protein